MTQQSLATAEGHLKQLRQSNQPNFPLLNEATRLVQQIEGSVSKMGNGDMKEIWREQVGELQKELQAATQRMLAPERPHAVSSQRYQAPSGRDIGGDMFSGLNVGAGPSRHGPGRAAAPPAASASALPTASAAAPSAAAPPTDLFSGLDMGLTSNDSGASAISIGPLPGSGTSAPLPEDLFTGLMAAAPAEVQPSVPPSSLAATGPQAPSPQLLQSLPHASKHRSRPSVTSSMQPFPDSPRSMLSAGSVEAALVRPASPATALPPMPAESEMSAASGLSELTVPVAAPAMQPSATASGTGQPADGRRKKKITRRVGYAREPSEDGQVARATAAGPSINARPQASAAPTPTVAPGQRELPMPAHSLLAAGLLPSSAAVPPGTSPSWTTSTPANPSSPSPTAVHFSSPGTQQTITQATTSDSSTHAPGQPGAASKLMQKRGSPQRSSPTASKPAGQSKAAASSAAAASAPPVSPTSPNQSAPAPLHPGSTSSPPAKSDHQRLSSQPQVDPGARFEQRLKAEKAQADRTVQQLSTGLLAAQEAEREARMRRRQLQSQAAFLTGQIAGMEQREAAAVEAEDFEMAASLSADLDSLKAQAGSVQADIRSSETACDQAVMEGELVAQRQAAAWQAAATALRALATSQSQNAASARQAAEKAATAHRDAETQGIDQMEELQGRIQARQALIDEEQTSVDERIAEATKPAVSRRDEKAGAHDRLEAEVEALRKQLAQREADLEAAAAELEAADAAIRGLAARYDRTLARLAADRQALAVDEEERATKQAELDEARAAARQAAVASEAELQSLLVKAKEAEEAAEDMESQAASSTARLEREQDARHMQSVLQTADQEAQQRLQQAAAQLEAGRAERREAAARTSALEHEAEAAEEQAQSARRRLPGLEADKKAAAAARDFKEAARLAAEAKAVTADAETGMERAAALRQQALEAEAAGAATAAELEALAAAVEAAEMGANAARLKRLLASQEGLQQQLADAIAAESFDEAEGLQAEVDAASAEIHSLGGVPTGFESHSKARAAAEAVSDGNKEEEYAEQSSHPVDRDHEEEEAPSFSTSPSRHRRVGSGVTSPDGRSRRGSSDMDSSIRSASHLATAGSTSTVLSLPTAIAPRDPTATHLRGLSWRESADGSVSDQDSLDVGRPHGQPGRLEPASLLSDADLASGLHASSTLETISAGSDVDTGPYSPRRPPLPSVQSSGNLSDTADAQSVAPSIDPSDLGLPSEAGAAISRQEEGPKDSSYDALRSTGSLSETGDFPFAASGPSEGLSEAGHASRPPNLGKLNLGHASSADTLTSSVALDPSSTPGHFSQAGDLHEPRDFLEDPGDRQTFSVPEEAPEDLSDEELPDAPAQAEHAAAQADTVANSTVSKPREEGAMFDAQSKAVQQMQEHHRKEAYSNGDHEQDASGYQPPVPVHEQTDTVGMSGDLFAGLNLG
ncbi:hypothetical protein WJX84_004969 [Apatococcus fuscideae]|uniref:UVR domain-containing protein n=1 Tax=Apatococcus fuscideae TaxID=2026836 RepID=A0AAW1TEI3_9CHLO